MLENLSQLFGVAWPILSGIVLGVIGVFAVDTSSKDPLKTEVDLKFVRIPVPIKNRVAVQGGVLVVALSTIAFAFIRDYTAFIPSDLRIKIFFDDRRVEETLSVFTEEELARFNLASNWKELKLAYINRLNTITADSLQSPFRFNENDMVCHSEGQVRFRMKKIGQRQIYEILECDAELTHIYDPPGGTRVDISSSSVLLPSAANKVRLRLRDMFLNGYIIIQPEVKQTTRVSSSRILYDHSLTAITRLEIFPYIEIGRTLFVAGSPDGRRFPVAYAEFTY